MSADVNAFFDQVAAEADAIPLNGALAARSPRRRRRSHRLLGGLLGGLLAILVAATAGWALAPASAPPEGPHPLRQIGPVTDYAGTTPHDDVVTTISSTRGYAVCLAREGRCGTADRIHGRRLAYEGTG